MLTVRNQKLLRPSLLFAVSATMASLFPSVMYVDDYWFFGLKHLGSPIDAVAKISESNSPVYSVYLLFSITSFIFSSTPIHFYLYFMSFLIWVMFFYTIFRIANESMKNSKVIFVGVFLLLFLLDRPSNQNIFWSTQAIGSYIQHLLPILILFNWTIFRSGKSNRYKILLDLGIGLLLFGFPGEVLICTVLYLVYLFVREKSSGIHLPFLIAFGFFIISLNLYSDGARNRGAELNRPENLSDLLNRFFNFYEFLIVDNFVFVLLSIAVGFLLGIFIECKVTSSLIERCIILLLSLIIAMSVVCVSAYQSIYHFIGINFLLQAISMISGLKLAAWFCQYRDIKFGKRKLNLITFLTIPVVVFIFAPLPQNISWLHQQSNSFLVYAELLLNNGPQLEKIEIYTFTDSSRIGVIGPNLPKWQSYGLISLDFVDAGVEEAITLITSKTNQ
jgi:hypothetical protein